MNRKNILIAAAVVSLVAAVVAQEELNLSLEDLFNQVPTIVTATASKQSLDQSPVAVFVISESDIRRSAATTLPDLLRAEPGLGVVSMGARDQQVNIRGLVGYNVNFSDKVLVMIDGRSVYWDVYGAVFWDMLPVSLEDIKQIEIVKSPSSSLYGANAFSGVINIITKKPGDEKGTVVNLRTGIDPAGTVSHSGKAGRGNFRVSASWDQTREWREPQVKSEEVARIKADLEQTLGGFGEMFISMAAVKDQGKPLFMSEMIGTAKLSGVSVHGWLDYASPWFKLLGYVRQENLDFIQLRDGKNGPLDTRFININLQRTLRARWNALTLGGEYKYNALTEKFMYAPAAESQHLWAVLADDEIRPFHNVVLGLGLRYDHHPLAGGQVSPHASLSVSPFEKQTLRLSANSAFHNPTFINSYLVFSFPVKSLQYELAGSTALKAEKVVSYEASYQGQFEKRFNVNADLFYRRYTSLFSNNEDFSRVPVVRMGFTNNQEGTGYGAEATIDALVLKNLTATAGGAYLHLEKFTSGSTQVPAKDSINPIFRFNAGVKWTVENFSLSLSSNWVDRTSWELKDTSGIDTLLDLPSYFMLGGQLAYTHGSAEIALSGWDILDSRHYEYPVGINRLEPSSDPSPRRWNLGVRYKF